MNRSAPDAWGAERQSRPDVSVVICTYNREAMLRGALDSVLSQVGAPSFELLVVDNNSTDHTSAIIADVSTQDPRVRQLRETRQGLSHARNCAIGAARGRLIAFTDDDVRAAPNWIASIVGAFDEHPGASVVGGRVLPSWPAGGPPSWLTRAHWTPLALVDYGPSAVRVSAERPLCLIGANMAFRREVFATVGLFEPSLQRVKNGIGSLEDHDFLLRCFAAGLFGFFDPRIVIHADVQPDRLTRAYHRGWHGGHGRFHARMRAPDVERSHAGTFLGVPAHIYRRAVGDFARWVGAIARGRRDEAFAHELKLRFVGGFLWTRVRDVRRDGRLSPLKDLVAMLRRLRAAGHPAGAAR
jgi:glucosyl-dolichyl phosphate glucuronosyltransferase